MHVMEHYAALREIAPWLLHEWTSRTLCENKYASRKKEKCCMKNLNQSKSWKEKQNEDYQMLGKQRSDISVFWLHSFRIAGSESFRDLVNSNMRIQLTLVSYALKMATMVDLIISVFYTEKILERNEGQRMRVIQTWKGLYLELPYRGHCSGETASSHHRSVLRFKTYSRILTLSRTRLESTQTIQTLQSQVRSCTRFICFAHSFPKKPP